MGFTKLQHNVEVTYQLLALFPHRIKTIQDARMEVQHNCQAAKKIADAKLATDFQTILKEFQKAERLAVEREAAYAPFFFSSRSARGNLRHIFFCFVAIVQGVFFLIQDELNAMWLIHYPFLAFLVVLKSRMPTNYISIC